MWRKREQYLIWITAYIPLFLLMIYRYIEINELYIEGIIVDFINQHFNKSSFSILVLFFILIISFFAYRIVVNYLFKENDRKLKGGNFGNEIYVRKYENLEVNEYSFFLLTLLLPLISLDYSSLINLMLSIVIIIFIIMVYVKTNTIIVCPIFFISKWSIFKAEISRYTIEEEENDSSLRKEVYLITKERSLDLNFTFQSVRLSKNVYYIVTKN